MPSVVLAPPTRPPAPGGAEHSSQKPSAWTRKYGDKHRLMRIRDFPPGITPPKPVRIYQRSGHFMIQWWDPQQGKNVAYRAEDLLDALGKARRVADRLAHFRTASTGKRRLDHAELVARYLADLRRRSDAGEIGPATVERFRTALDHYLSFCEQPGVAKKHPHASAVDREFRLAFAGFLANRWISSNGRAGAARRPMTGGGFVLDTVRALFEWAADPERGGLLPEGFRNPFRRAAGQPAVLKGDPLAEPDITTNMAIDLVSACDGFQLRLFGPLLLFGLRASEPCFTFLEDLSSEWLHVPCHSDLGHRTKGRRDKRFPLLGELRDFWDELLGGRNQGLLYVRRAVAEGREHARRRGASLAELAAEYHRRCSTGQTPDAATREKIRDLVLHQAGGLTYDHIQGEFAMLARRLRWPRHATLKDLRHLFATTMHNAGMPEAYRRYLMGQSPGRDAIVAYTHLNKLRRHYAEALQGQWAGVVAAIRRRLGELRSAPAA